MSESPSRQFFYGATVFLSSACGLVIEVVAGRLLAPYVGMSLYTWTAIIAVVLAGFSIGHWVGGRLADARCDGKSGARRVAVALALASASSLAVPVLLRLLSMPLLSAGLTPVLAIVFLATGLFLLPSLFVGMVSPILTKLAVDASLGRHGEAIGRMYALSAVGAIFGTLTTGYLFIAWIGSIGTVLTVVAIYAALALGFARSGRATGMIAALFLILGTGFGFAAIRTKALVSPCTAESAYYCIRIDDFTQYSAHPSAVMVLDHLAHGINDRDDPRLLYSAYLQFLDEYVKRRFAGRAPSAFVIGGGALTLPRAWADMIPDSKVLVAEIDPGVTRAARTYMWAAPHNSVGIVHGDGRAILQALPTTMRFDVVFGDAFHDISIPAHLVTREFHQAVNARLTPGGFYALNVIEAGHAPRFLASLVRTLAADFSVVEVWLDEADVRSAERIDYMVIAGNNPTPGDTVLHSTYGIHRSWLRLSDAQLASRINFAEAPILTDDFAPVDRLLSHIIFDPRLSER